MAELKFINRSLQGRGQADSPACACSDSPGKNPVIIRQQSNPDNSGRAPRWVSGTLQTPVGTTQKISTTLTGADHWEHVKCRASAFRESYTVPPGLYAVGDPDKDSDLLISANYKLSFDLLRRELTGLNVWVLVLDTKGINVWCAAGKGTFGTDELVRRITQTQLNTLLEHRRIIVPQLGAPGISAEAVRKATGFSVYYGPIDSRDIPAYLSSGYQASRAMRAIRFPLKDRLILTPMEINPAMKKYPYFALASLFFFGLQPSGLLFREAAAGSLPFLVLGLIAVLSGAFLTPLLLPMLPSRSFAVKGWLVGMLSTIVCMRLLPAQQTLLTVFSILFFPAASSYIALQFTGSTTFTGMSGVKKELKYAIPAYLATGAVSVLVLIIFKLYSWRIL